MNTRVELLDKLLPQTQCTRCGYPRCLDYAIALDEGSAGINQCPPGGDHTIAALAETLNQVVVPLDTSFGELQPRLLARIDESRCIGCVLCIKACPVDAILGANKLMHAVIDDYCTGCELCVPVCPTDCIDIIPFAEQCADGSSRWPEYSQTEVDRARQRTEQRLSRQATDSQKKPAAIVNRKDMKADILAAVQRRKNKQKN